jgi:hypothetical protein
MTNNPLIAKYEELYGKKKEEPKKVEYELPVDFKTKLAELRDTSTIPSVATSNTGITAANHITFKSLISYDPPPANDSFLQIAEKVKNGEAKVSYMSMNRDIMSGTSITFEVRVWDTP